MKTILIAEDEPAYASLLRRVLAKRYKVYVAGDGQEGLEMALKYRPDLILLDIKMPVMDGMTMLKKLRRSAYGKTVRVVLLTNLEPSHRIIEQVIEDLPLSYWVKSDIELGDVIERADELLAVSGKPRSQDVL